MGDTNEAPSLRIRIKELEQSLGNMTLLLETERERLYLLERDVATLNEIRGRLERENEHYRGLIDSPSFARPGEICVRPHLGPAQLHARRNVGFIIMPFGPDWADSVDRAVAEALKQKGMRCQRADRRPGREIMKDSWIGMCEAGLVIADVTDRNPNVMYELGLIDAVGQNVILIGQSARPGDLPFDLLGHRILVYSASDPLELARDLAARIEDMRADPSAAADRRG